MSNLTQKLSKIHSEVGVLIEENSDLDSEQITQLRTIQEIIECNFGNKNSKNLFDVYNRLLVEWATLNFTIKAPIDNNKTIFTYISSMINLLIEEIEDAVVSKNFYEETLEEIVLVKPDFMITTDIFGMIRFSTSTTEDFIGFTKEDLLKQHIGIIFSKENNTFEDINDFILTFNKNIKTIKYLKTSFLDSIPQEEKIVTKYGFCWLIRKCGEPISVSVSIKRILNHVIDGYVYSFKEQTVLNDIIEALKQKL